MEGWQGNGGEARVARLGGIVQVSAGSHSLAVSRDGKLYSWGSNRYGALGLGDQVTHSNCCRLAP